MTPPFQPRRTDANHKDFCNACRALRLPYCDLSALGKGIPDLLVLIRGVWHLIEIKDGSKPPSARRLTPDQIELHQYVKEKGGTIHIMKYVDELYQLAGARLAAQGGQMNFDALAAAFIEFTEACCRAGLDRPFITKPIMDIEESFTKELIEKRNRFLRACKVAGTAAMAEREGITQRAVRKRRNKYLNEKGNQFA